MEKGDRDAGTRILISREVVWECGDGELVQIHHRPAQEQEQWKPGLGEDQAYRRDEDRGDVGRMETGTNHPNPPQCRSRSYRQSAAHLIPGTLSWDPCPTSQQRR